MDKKKSVENDTMRLAFVVISLSVVVLILFGFGPSVWVWQLFKIMPAKHVIDIKTRLLITTWEGEVTDDDFIAGLKAYQKNIQSKSDYSGFNEVLDLTKITDIKISTKGLITIGSIASKTDSKEIKTKLAFIVSSNLAYGLVRMYEVLRTLSKNSTKTLRAFKKESDAFEWLQK